MQHGPGAGGGKGGARLEVHGEARLNLERDDLEVLARRVMRPEPQAGGVVVPRADVDEEAARGRRGAAGLRGAEGVAARRHPPAHCTAGRSADWGGVGDSQRLQGVGGRSGPGGAGWGQGRRAHRSRCTSSPPSGPCPPTRAAAAAGSTASPAPTAHSPATPTATAGSAGCTAHGAALSRCTARTGRPLRTGAGRGVQHAPVALGAASAQQHGRSDEQREGEGGERGEGVGQDQHVPRQAADGILLVRVRAPPLLHRTTRAEAAIPQPANPTSSPYGSCTSRTKRCTDRSTASNRTRPRSLLFINSEIRAV